MTADSDREKPFMEYTHLTDRDVAQLRRERLVLLEADHVRACLVLEEDPTDQHAHRDAAELRRRIEHHRAFLAPPAEEGVSTDGAEVEGVGDSVHAGDAEEMAMR